MNIGFDFGSKNIGYALTDNGVISGGCVPHYGNIRKTFFDLCDTLFKKYDRSDFKYFGITHGLHFYVKDSIDPVIASVEANHFLKTGCQNILSAGYESFYFVLLNGDGTYREHIVNSDCSAGTGGFIDQQAERLGVSTEKLSDMAFDFKGNAPPIATRCTVFAKSDIVHAQASGYSKESIAAGICIGAAGCIIENILKGNRLEGDVLLIGGVSANKLVVSEISQKSGINIRISPYSGYFNAIGSAFAGKTPVSEFDPERIIDNLKSEKKMRNKLEMKLTNYPDFNHDRMYVAGGVEVSIYSELVKETYSIYLGLDIGSTSTKLIAMEEDGLILAGLYTRTKSEPIKAIQSLFHELGNLFSGRELKYLGVGVTGSGRDLVKKVINADIAVNEISAHATGAAFIDPEVDSIIEIGGQDSKYTVVKDGQVVNSVMNYVCAAGTGSFIEEQAKRLEIPLDRLSDMAIESAGPFTSERCTVYMERDVIVLQSEGYGLNEIAAAVLFSVRDNYLSKIVGKMPIGNRVYFQGATAKNKALVAAFENKIGRPILVSRYCHLTGSLGAALHVKKLNLKVSRFAGINSVIGSRFETCMLCSNKCNMNIYESNGTKTAWGLKCGREYEDDNARKLPSPSALEIKYDEYFSTVKNAVDKSVSTLKAGLPRSLYMEQYFYLFDMLFKNLGIETVFIPVDKKALSEGKKTVNADFCAPMNIIHGEMKLLLDKNPDFIFFPTITNDSNYFEKTSKEKKLHLKKEESYYCYYSAYASTILQHHTMLDAKNKIISRPMLKPGHMTEKEIARLVSESLSDVTGKTEKEIIKAYLDARKSFDEKNVHWRTEGDIALGSSDKLRILLLGRPYTVFNKAINNDIPKKFEDLGYEVLHQSMFDLDKYKNGDIPGYVKTMHWYYGQQLLLATKIIEDNPGLYPVMLTCFRCSPDAYVINYFKEILKRIGRPYLIIQLDEHGNDIGYQTRIEAAVDSFKNDFSKKQGRMNKSTYRFNAVKKISRDDVFFLPEYIPILNDLLLRVYKAYGYNVRNIPVNENDINEGYRYASGGECMPNIAILGSMINIIKKENLDLDRCVFSATMSCVACNFSQFYRLTNLALENAGISGVRFSQETMGGPMPLNLPMTLKLEISAVSIIAGILYKVYHKYRAYEVNKGDTDRALERSLDILEKQLNENTGLIQTGKKILKALPFMLLIEVEYDRMKNDIKYGKLSGGILDTVFKSWHPADHLMKALKEVRAIFENIPVKRTNKPKIALIGDMYIKWNSMINQKITDLIEDLGGEIIMPSFTEYVSHILFYDLKNKSIKKYLYNQIYVFEKSFEKIFEGILDKEFEPDQTECDDLAREYGFQHFIPGEVEINAGKILYMHRNKIADAFINVNPVFCCPGVISSSIFRKMQEDLNVPIIDLFYDGTNRPNGRIIPHMHYLKEKNSGR